MPTPGQRWKAAREAAGLSAADAASLAGVHRNTIYDLEKDDEGVTLRMMKRVAPVYGVDLGDIFQPDAESPERVPIELRPLADILRPLTQQDRESIVRNIATNLSFMGRLYGRSYEVETRKVATSGLQNETSRSAGTYTSGTTPKNDVPRLPAHLLTEQPDSPQGGTRHADSGRQRHQSPTKGRPR